MRAQVCPFRPPKFAPSSPAVKPRLYLETTIPSYLAARPNTNAVIAGHQQTTHEWWAVCHDRFDLFISQFVLDEAARGNAVAASGRLAVLAGISELDVLPDVCARHGWKCPEICTPEQLMPSDKGESS